MGGKRKRQQSYGKRPQRTGLWQTISPDVSMFFPNTNDVDKTQKPLTAPPKKPTSQKAATMPAEPSEEQVSLLMEFCPGVVRSEAVRHLKAKKNDLNDAVTAVMNGDDISKDEATTQWDEGAWSTDRDGNKVDGFLHPLAASTTATRPNSPAPSIRETLHPVTKQQEDEDMARALAMSQQDIRGGFQQETGVIGPGGEKTFGPANRDFYDKDKWAMTFAGAQETNEVVPDVDVENRVHVHGEPRLLKHLPNGDYTPNLLTILHSISGTREAMLMREHVQLSYGQDAEWWRGHSVMMPKIVHIEDGTLAAPVADKQDDLIAEVQRIMAFLSSSTRSYGNIGALTQTDVIKETSPATTRSRTLMELFLQNWMVAASSRSGSTGDMTALFSTSVGTTSPEGMETADMNMVDLQVAIKEGAKCDLFELLDGLLWETDADDTKMSDNYIEAPAEVLVMRVHQVNPSMAQQLRVEVPAELYVDKYLKDNINATRAVRLEMAKGKRRITKIEEIEKKLKTWQHPKKSEQLDAGMLLKHTLGHFTGQNGIDAAKADKTYSPTADDEADTRPAHYAEVTQKLEKVIASIDNKLTVLAQEKEKTRKAIIEMSKAPPPGLQPQDLQHRYTLRGVATKPNITYVLCPGEAEVDEMFDDESTPNGMRWWRMEYEVNGSGAKVTKTKTADYDVIRAVELEHHSALLVYASDAANSFPPQDDALPRPLQEFVDRDNELFALELEAERNKPPAYDLADIPRDSIERASMDSNRAEGGGSNSGALTPAFEDDTFMGHPDFGLPPDLKQGYRQDEDEVHEIRLDEDEGLGAEMVEMPHEPFIPGLHASSDTMMGDAQDESQDQGVGGAPHLQRTRW